jgi:MFS transporter, APGE family, 1-arseno-3-phosphoglycerate exporter
MPDMASPFRQYMLITANYWAFTLTDGALRMLVVLYFHQLGYSPLQIASLFLFYEFFGIVTNLLGGWLAARIGLNRTMSLGICLQLVALAMLLLPDVYLTVLWVMAAQALSGIAKDLNKMSAKSAVKLLVQPDESSKLYRLVAALTGSKNTLKGVGFFMGGALLSLFGFQGAVLALMLGLAAVALLSLRSLQGDLGKVPGRLPFSRIFSKSASVNLLAAARVFLFGARDVWFVVALPVHLSTAYFWSHSQVGGFLALWIVGYGIVQALAPRFTQAAGGRAPDGHTASIWALPLAVVPLAIAMSPGVEDFLGTETLFGIGLAELSLLGGLLLFGVLFAVNSSVHSYLIVSYADREHVSLDVGFYYMANAAGRLLGTVLSGWVYQSAGLGACLLISSSMLLAASVISLSLPRAN